jgi:hypothetical protein
MGNAAASARPKQRHPLDVSIRLMQSQPLRPLVVTRVEVFVKAAHRKTSFLHQFCDSDPGKAFFADLFPGNRNGPRSDLFFEVCRIVRAR